MVALWYIKFSLTYPDLVFCRFGPTIALLFVLGVAAVKAIVEDKKRHAEDFKTNSTHCHIVHEDGETSSPEG